MVELLGGQICQKGPFLKIFAAPLAPRATLRFTTTLYIKFDHMPQLFSKFRHFRKFFTKMRIFFEIWTPKAPKKHFLLHFSPTFFGKGQNYQDLREFWQTVTTTLFGHHLPPHSSFLIELYYNCQIARFAIRNASLQRLQYGEKINVLLNHFRS